MSNLFKTKVEKGTAYSVNVDMDLFIDIAKRFHMKKLAIDTCASFLARTISQSEFRIKNGNEYLKDELYYRLNVRPNKNQTASTFWQTIIYKFIYDNEALIIQSDDDDLLIADSFTHDDYAVYEDMFSNVTVKDYTFKRVFKQSEVLHLRYSNERLTPLIDSLYKDYGELFGRIFDAQKRKNQIRSTVKLDAMTAKDDEALAEVQEFINKMYKAFAEKDIAITPEQPGFEYKEHSNGSSASFSVEEINKVTDGFFDQVAMALNIPLPLIKGNQADVAEMTKNYMKFTVNPLVKKIADEGNAKFFTKEEFLGGKCIEVKTITYQSILEMANNIDKLRASGIMNGNEIRAELGLEKVDLPIMEEYFITKNYAEIGSLKGGENSETNE